MKAAQTIFLSMLLASTASAALAHDTARDAVQRQSEIFKPGISIAREHPEAGLAAGTPPLYYGIGAMGMPISTGSSAAQAYFDQALSFAFAFNHAESRRSFVEAQRRDPACAMCFWGEAYTYGANINDPMHEDAVGPAAEAIGRAMALRDGASEKERALIEALARRYAAGRDRSELEKDWAAAITDVADRWSDDVTILTLKAEALMNLQPWDYWEADGVTPKGGGAEIVATLEKALALDPDHPAAIHFYIHAVEASATPERAEPYADRLRGATPALGHLVHMPAHIYMRVGRHADLMDVNRDAAAADETLFAQIGDAASPIYRYGYYPHNVHFLLVGALNSGLSEDALQAAAKLDGILSEEVMRRLAWTQLIKTAPLAVHATFSDAETVLAIPRPSETLPLVVGWWHYARGVALARSGDVEGARVEIDALAALLENGDFDAIEAQFVPARAIVETALHVLEARTSSAAGDLADAELRLRKAIAVEATLPYMEPPFWHYPVQQSLGALLLQQDRPEEALGAFASALEVSPRNGWALWGLAEARAKSGDAEGAASARAEFERVWLGDMGRLRLDHL